MLNQINRNIPELLNNSKHIAIVGLSNKPNRISHGVGSYLLQAGFNILPVNPNYNSVLGLKCYPNLTEIPHSIDIVNIFRRSENVPSIVEEAISIKPKVIWMQLGIVNEQAAKLAIDSGFEVVMNRCIKIEHMAL